MCLDWMHFKFGNLWTFSFPFCLSFTILISLFFPFYGFLCFSLSFPISQVKQVNILALKSSQIEAHKTSINHIASLAICTWDLNFLRFEFLQYFHKFIEIFLLNRLDDLEIWRTVFGLIYVESFWLTVD